MMHGHEKSDSAIVAVKPRPDGRKLAWVADKNNAVNAAQRIEQRRQLLLGEHGGFIDDHCFVGRNPLDITDHPVTLRGFVIPRRAKGLRNRPRLDACRLLQPNARLSCRREQPNASLLNWRGPAQELEKRCFARAGRADEHGKPGRGKLVQGSSRFLDDSEQYLRAREAEAMCDHVWIFEARTLSTRSHPEGRKARPSPG
jgi:hypothetical protein